VICCFHNKAFAENNFAKLLEETIACGFTLHQRKHATQQLVDVIRVKVSMFSRNEIQKSCKVSQPSTQRFSCVTGMVAQGLTCTADCMIDAESVTVSAED
jgi:hypothetical protein